MATIPQQVVAPFTRILFTTDFSPCSEHALSYALAIAAEYKAKMSVLSVIHEQESATGEARAQQRSVENHYRQIENSGCLQRIDHSMLIRHGDFLQSLAKVVEDDHIDLVVLGTHGRTGFEKFLFGSHAEEVFRNIACPVVTIGPNCQPSTKPLEPTKILYATDFMSGSLRAVPFIVSLASKSQAQLVLLHVIEDADALVPAEIENVPIRSVEHMKSLIPADSNLKVEPQVITRFGVTENVILSVADEANCDLIAMGTRPSRVPGAISHFPWSTTSSVIAHAKCPVLTVRG